MLKEIRKQRASAFYQNQLDMLLRSQGINELILGGLSTSGITLSTVREAWDKDYKLTVLEDVCWDPDEEIHDALVRKIFPKQASVISLADFESQTT